MEITDISFSNLAIPPLNFDKGFANCPGIERFSSFVGVKTFSSKLADQEITVKADEVTIPDSPQLAI